MHWVRGKELSFQSLFKIYLTSCLSKILKLTTNPIGCWSFFQFFDRCILKREFFVKLQNKKSRVCWEKLLCCPLYNRQHWNLLHSRRWYLTKVKVQEWRWLYLNLLNLWRYQRKSMEKSMISCLPIRESIPESVCVGSFEFFFRRLTLGRRFFFWLCLSPSWRISSSDATWNRKANWKWSSSIDPLSCRLTYVFSKFHCSTLNRPCPSAWLEVVYSFDLTIFVANSSQFVDEKGLVHHWNYRPMIQLWIEEKSLSIVELMFVKILTMNGFVRMMLDNRRIVSWLIWIGRR